MRVCEDCGRQLLPYLYDLLDGDERRQVQRHLEGCSACQAALEAARGQQQLLAEAVKDEFSGVAFAAPAPKAAPAAPTEALPRPARRRFPLNRWALAASLLLVLFLGGGGLSWTAYRHRAGEAVEAEQRWVKAKQDLRQVESEVERRRAKAQAEILAVQEQIDRLLTDWKEEENKTRKVLEDKRVQFIITAPRNVVAGANNSFQLDLRKDAAPEQPGKSGDANQLAELPRNEKRLAAPSNVQVRVLDQRTQEVFYQQNFALRADQQRVNFDLPQNLPIRPGADLALELQTEGVGGAPAQVRDHLSLVFPEYVTHLTTDRPTYRPGDPVRFRSLTLDRFSLKPAGEPLTLRYRVAGPNDGEVFSGEMLSEAVDAETRKPVAGPDGTPVQGVGAGECRLPDGLPPGRYTLTCSEANERFPEERRSFLVHRRQPARYRKDIAFHRPAYGPGESVRVTVRAAPVGGEAQLPGWNFQAGQGPAQNGAPALPPGGGEGMAPGAAGPTINLRATVDGAEVYQNTSSLDPAGAAGFEFPLPQQLQKGVGLVTAEVHDAAGVETLVRPLPLVLRDLSIDFYPEGGDLVAGVPNRVYLQARTPAGSPADIQGRVVDETGAEVARVRPLADDREPGLNLGLAAFTFTPRAGATYELKLDAPLGIPRRFLLPRPKAEGVVLHLPRGVAEGPIPVELHSVGKDRDLLVGAYCRGRLLDHKPVRAAAGRKVDVTLDPRAAVGGVYRITVFERRAGAQAGEEYVPLAERLTYRRGAQTVAVRVTPDKPTYHPGDKVRLGLETRDEKDARVPAVALVAVAEAGALPGGRSAHSMPTHFLLTSEIRRPEDLENADVLLGPHPKAAEALDLLLGTQGWRRFAEQQPQRFQQNQAAGRLATFLATGEQVQRLVDAEREVIEKVDQNHVARFVELQKQLAEQEKAEPVPAPQQKELLTRTAGANGAHEAYLSARDRLAEAWTLVAHFVLSGAVVLLLVLGFFTLGVGLRRVAADRRAAPWLLAGLAQLALLFLGSVAGTFYVMQNEAAFGLVGGPPQPRAQSKEWSGPTAPAAPVVQAEEAVEVLLQRQQGQARADAQQADEDVGDEAKPAEAKAEPAAPGPAFAGTATPAGDVALTNLAVNNGALGGVGGPPALGASAPALADGPDDERRLRQTGKYQSLLRRQLGRRVPVPAGAEPAAVREYAHQHRPAPDGPPRDAPETLYWHPVLVMPDGRAEVAFDLSDAVADYRVRVLTHTLDGRLGADTTEVRAQLPVRFEPQVPAAVTSTDEVGVPVAISNSLAVKGRLDLSARARGLEPLDAGKRAVALEPGEKAREVFRFRPGITGGPATLRVLGRLSGGSAAVVEKTLEVEPAGFPAAGSQAGILDGAATHELALPPGALPGSVRVQAHAYPSVLAELQQAADALRAEPAAGFEPVASITALDVLALNHLRATRKAGPALEKRARARLAEGYERMLRFECADPARPGDKRGFGRFAPAARPDLALTAHALLQLRAAAAVYPVDPAVLERTQAYLLDQRDGKGGFGGAPAADAYTLWALAAGGGRADLDKELRALHATARESKDPYVVALVALGHQHAGRAADAAPLLQRLREFQQPEGNVAGARTSITRSAGRDLAVETTALAALAWLGADGTPELRTVADAAMHWVRRQRDARGAFGAPQATTLALRALLAHAGKESAVVRPGALQLSLTDGAAAETAFQGSTQEPVTVTLSDAQGLQPGRNSVQLTLTENNQLPYLLTWSCRTAQPPAGPAGPVKLTTTLDRAQAREGETIKLTAVLENTSGRGQGMAVAVIGLPSGLALPDDPRQLSALARPGPDGKTPPVISAWELRGRELVLYWEELAPAARVPVALDLVCRLPGVYRGPASRAYLYYNGEHQHWAEPLAITIAPTGQ